MKRIDDETGPEIAATKLGAAGWPGVRRGIASAFPPGLRLGAGEVHVWRIALDATPDAVAAELRAVLSVDERQRAQTFFFDRDRVRFSIGRGVLRVLLGHYLDCAPADIVFRYGSNGRPELALPAGAGVRFNLAHSEGLAVCGFTLGREIGLDVERVRIFPGWEFIAASCFSVEEQARVNQAAGERRLAEFFMAWTRQEALLKATGRGFGGEGGRISPAADRGGPRPGLSPDPRLGAAYTDGSNPAFLARRLAPLNVYPINLGPEYAAALAVSPDVRSAISLGWDPPRRNGQPGGSARRLCRVALDKFAQIGVEFL